MDQKEYIAFDQFQRYQTICNLISILREQDQSQAYKVLEIGSNEHKDLSLFLPQDQIVFTDITLSDAMAQDPDFQQADGTALQFEDDSFDFVVAADVLEHVPQEKRSIFCRELSRVARKAVIMCFPYANSEIEAAEERLNVYYKSLYHSDFIWLKEHSVQGLPQIAEIEGIFASLRCPYKKFFHGNLHTWEKMWYCHFDTCESSSLVAYRQEIDHYYNTEVYASDVMSPCYRVFFVSCKDVSDLEKMEAAQIWKPSSEAYETLNLLLEKHRNLVTHFEKNQMEDAEHAAVATLFWAREGEVFQESMANSWTWPQKKSNVSISQQFEGAFAQLRFDPMEAPCVVEDLHIYSNVGSLKGVPENGAEYDGKLVFWDADPRIRIETDGQTITSLEIRAHVTPLEYPEQSELLQNLLQEISNFQLERGEFADKQQEFISALAEKEDEYDKELQAHRQTITAREKTIQELQASLDNYVQHYQSAIAQREELKVQLAQAQFEYQKIQNAFFWKLTKPARVLMECIKRPLRRVKWLDPVRKVWRYWRTNGLRSTLRRVGEKLSNKQEFEIDFEHLLFTPAELKEQRKHTFDKKYRFSIVVPLYNTPPRFLKEMIQSVINQTYGNWELCMADGSDAEHPEVEKICRKYGKKDSRIRYKKLEKNLGISGNTNACLDMATGDYIGLFDHDDLLHPAALFEVMRTICETGADFVYTDEATFSGRVTNVITAHFKPNFAPDNLRANNYICHFSVFSRKVLQEAGNFSSKYDGSQDHDFILRATEKAQKVVHIPELLYYWRSHPNSVAEDINSKTYAIDAGKRAVADHITRLGMSATVESSIAFPTIYRIKYALMSCPLISIIIPNKNHFEDITKCVNSILSKSSYSNYEIIIVDNGSTDQAVLDYYRELAEKEKRVIVKVWNHPFNFSAMNNYGVGFASGEHIILLNSDTQVIADNWIEEMLMYSQRTDVGAVGAKLYYEDETIQHAGVILGMGAHRTAGHAFYRVSKSNVGYMGRLYYAQNYSAVTAACIMIPKHVWEEIGGLDESFAVAFNDVDLCMRIRKAGYLIVWTPYAELYHYESKSRGLEDTPEKQKRFEGEVRRFQERWKKELAAGDPYYNPNLTLDREDFSSK